MEGQTAPIVVTRQAGTCVVEFAATKLLDEVEIARISEQLDTLARETTPPLLVLDFSNIGHMSSSALGMLITLHKRVRERDGRMSLCNVRSEIYRVFSITKLSDVFQIYENRAMAMAGLA